MITFQQDAIDVMEHYRNYTADNINKLQAGLIPAFLDISWCKSESYYHDTKEYISRLSNQVVLKVEGVRNNLFNQYTDYVYLDGMINAHKMQKVQPFMLFINGRFIKWSDITVVRDYDDVWLVVNNIDSDTVLSTVDIIYIPFIVEYVEYKAYNTNNTLIFRFDEDGTEGGNDIFISTPDKHIRILDYKSNSIEVLDKIIGVDKHVKLSSDNIITFDNNILNRTYDIIVRNLSLLTINKGVPLNNLTYKIFYSTYSNGNIANIVPFDGTDYLRKVQKGNILNNRLEIDKLETDLNMMFTKDKSYELNVHYNIKAMFKYNQGLFDELYKAKSNVYTLTKSGKDIKKLSINGVVRLNKWFSENDCYIVIFLNGYLYNAYNTVTYSLNSISFNIDTNVIRDSDIFEIIYFKDVYNSPIYSNISHGEFVSPKFHEYDELKVISEYDEINKTSTPGVYHYNKFNLNSNNTITFEDSMLYNKDLYILSDRQFKYHREEVATTSNIFNPPDDFKTCINPNKYLVFVNSRLVNKINYKLTLDDKVYNSISFTFKRNINIGDVLEIFYVPDEIDYINSGFKLVMDRCKFISKSDNQSEFRITYPFDRYIKNKDGCVVSVGGTIISPNRYTIDSSKLIFTDGTKIKKGRVVQLIFLYNLFKADYAVVSKKTHIKMVTKKVKAITNNQKVFNLPIPNIETGFLVCYNSVYIDPSRYTVAAGKLTFGGTASLNTNEVLTFIYGYNEYEDLYVKLKNKSSVIFDKNVSYVLLPTLRTDNFFMSINTVFIDPERYEIDDSSLRLTFLDPKDYLNTGDRVTIIYIDDELGSDGFKRYNKLFTYTYYAEEPNQMIFEMPYMYDDCLFDKDSFIVSLGSTFIDSDRYEIDNINCTLKLLYPEDALQPDEGISYIYAARILSEDGLFGSPYELAIINLLTRQYITVSDKEHIFTLPIPEASIKDKFIVSINGVFIDSQRYDINNGKLILKDPYDYPEKGIIINFIYAYNRVDKRYISILNKTYENTVENANIFDLPTKYKDNFLVSTNSSFINTDRYSSSYGALVLDEEADYLIPGDRLTYLYFPEDLNSEGDLRRNKFRMYTTYVTDSTQVEYDIPYMNSVSIYSEDSFILLVNGVIYDKQLYYVANNRLYLKTPLGYATGITFVYSTSILADDEMFGESLERDVIKFEDKVVTIKTDNQLTFSIPLPDRDKDCPFYLVYGSVLIDNSLYTIDRIANTITIVEPTAINLVKGKELIFTFIHSDFIVVHKEIVKVKVDKNNQKIFTPRRVDENYPTTVVKELVFKGSTLLDDSTYYKGNRHRYVFDRKTSFKIGQELTFMYLYLGDDENNPRILPESGYIYIDRENAKHNLNKDLYFLFINGKKIDRSNILDICDNLVRVERFPGTRYNVSMLSFTRMIPEFETLKYKRSSLTEVLDILMADDLDLILNRFNRMIGPLEEESIDKIVDVTNDNIAGDNIIVPIGTGGTITNGAQLKTLGINMSTMSSTEVIYEYNNNSISKVSSKDIASPTGLGNFGGTAILDGTNIIHVGVEYVTGNASNNYDQTINVHVRDTAGKYYNDVYVNEGATNTMETYWSMGNASYKNGTILLYITKRCEDANGIWIEYVEVSINSSNAVKNVIAVIRPQSSSDIMDPHNGVTFGNLFDGTYINTFTDNKLKVKPIITTHDILSSGTLIAKGIEASYDIYYDGVKEASFNTGIKADPSTFSTYMNTMFSDRFSAYLYAANCTIFRISPNKYIVITPKDKTGKSSVKIIENNTVLNTIDTEYDFYLTRVTSFMTK